MFAKMVRSCVTVSSAVVLFICMISGRLLYASITSRYMFSSNGPAKSTWSRCHTDAENCRRYRGVCLGEFAVS